MPISKVSSRGRLSYQVHRALRSALLARTFAPGSKLIVRELAEHLDLSPTPVKEALTTLAKEGLVRSEARRGFFVQQLGARDIAEIYSIRQVHEGLAARLATPKVTARSISRLRRLVDKQAKLATRGDFEAYGDSDMQFHQLIWTASDNRRLVEIAEGLMGQVRLLMSTSAEVPGRLEKSIGEHREIVRLMAEGLPDAAADAMMRHIRNAGDDLYRYLAAEGAASDPSSPTAVGGVR
ncbi:MAG: GntR family transcriptional regulator [Trueperaceae bacterium]